MLGILGITRWANTRWPPFRNLQFLVSRLHWLCNRNTSRRGCVPDPEVVPTSAPKIARGHDGTYPPACPEGVADGEEPACQYRSWTPNHSSLLLHRRPRVCEVPHESARDWPLQLLCADHTALSRDSCLKTVFKIVGLKLPKSEFTRWSTNDPKYLI